jgi:hypothetical protein
LSEELQEGCGTTCEVQPKEAYPESLADKVLDIKAFLETIDGGRVFTQELLLNAARQLQNAKIQEDLELIDCHGIRMTIPKDDSVDGYVYCYGMLAETEHF